MVGWFFVQLKQNIFKHIYKSEGFSDGNFELKTNIYRIGHYVFPQLIWAHLHRHLHRVRASRWLGYHDYNYPDVKGKIRAARHAIGLDVVYTLRKWIRKQICFLCSSLFFCQMCGTNSIFVSTSACENPLENDAFYIKILHTKYSYFTKCVAFVVSLFQSQEMLRHCLH